MSLPGFHAEASLPRSAGTYRGRTSFGGANAAAVRPMAPCCDLTDTKQLKVTFRHTVCKPLIDFIVASRADQVLARAAAAMPSGESSAPASIGGIAGRVSRLAWNQIVCQTSNGPWDATLVERRACMGYAPVHTLTILAHGEPVTFQWNGGLGNHPPEVGLVDCRQVSNSRTRCPGSLSTCDCRSTSCGAGESCPCGIEGQW